MQKTAIHQEASDLFDINFMGKLYYVLTRPDYFGKIISWRDDDPNVFEMLNEDKFVWTLLPFLISPNSTIFTWHEIINGFGFVPAFVQNNLNKLYRKPNLDRHSNREAWIKEWQRIRIERYFNRSQEGLMFKALQNGSRFIRWNDTGTTIEIRHIEDFVRREIYTSGSFKSVKSFVSRLRGCKFQTRLAHNNLYLVRHPQITAATPVEAWLNVFEWTAFKARLSARLRKQLKTQIDKQVFLDKVEPVRRQEESNKVTHLDGKTDIIVTFKEQSNRSSSKPQNRLQYFRQGVRRTVDLLYQEMSDLKARAPTWIGDFEYLEYLFQELMEISTNMYTTERSCIEVHDSGNCSNRNTSKQKLDPLKKTVEDNIFAEMF